MTTTASSNLSPRKPRRRPAPSDRDQQIYIDYQITGKTQIDLAADHHLTQSRISQIIRRVQKWLHSTWNLEPGTLNSAADSAAERHLARRLESERLNFVCRAAMQHFQKEQKTITHKKGTRGDKSFDETTERIAPASVQCLKVILQANRQLQQRHDKSAEEENQPPSDEALREQVEAWLTSRREDAQRTGKVRPDPNPHIIVRDVVNSLLGEKNLGLALDILAREAGQKLVDRKPYDDSSPQVPPENGWYYPMYDAHGSLVAWLSAEQMATATAACGVDLSSLEPALRRTGAVPPKPPSATSSTYAPSTNSPQPDARQTLAPLSPPTQTPPPQESQVLHLLPPVASYA